MIKGKFPVGLVPNPNFGQTDNGFGTGYINIPYVPRIDSILEVINKELPYGLSARFQYLTDEDDLPPFILMDRGFVIHRTHPYYFSYSYRFNDEGIPPEFTDGAFIVISTQANSKKFQNYSYIDEAVLTDILRKTETTIRCLVNRYQFALKHKWHIFKETPPPANIPVFAGYFKVDGNGNDTFIYRICEYAQEFYPAWLECTSSCNENNFGERVIPEEDLDNLIFIWKELPRPYGD